MKNYKIVFVDIDNTLNPPNTAISEHTKDVMHELKNKGIKVVACTSHSAKYSELISKEVGLSDYIISSSGAEIYDANNKKQIFSKSISKSTIRQVYKYAISHDLTIVLNSFAKSFISSDKFNYEDNSAIYFDDIEEILSNYSINQVVLLGTNYNRMLVLPYLFKDKYSDINISDSSNSLIEYNKNKPDYYFHAIVSKNTSKSKGIIELLDYLDLSSNDAISIGAGYSDICMCDVCHTSIAMDEGTSALKKVSTFVISSKDDGAAKMLEKLCLNRGE
jgi:Cof subfamily protein (haloacid dehalogenase superfamily)